MSAARKTTPDRSPPRPGGGPPQPQPDADLAPLPLLGLPLQAADRLLPLALAPGRDLQGEGERLPQVAGRQQAPRMLVPGLDVRVDEEPGDPVPLLERGHPVGGVGTAADVEQQLFPVGAWADQLHSPNPPPRFIIL